MPITHESRGRSVCPDCGKNVEIKNGKAISDCGHEILTVELKGNADIVDYSVFAENIMSLVGAESNVAMSTFREGGKTIALLVKK